MVWNLRVSSIVPEAARLFGEFDATANEQSYEVSPQPFASLNTGNWNALLVDATTDYPESLDLRYRKNIPVDVLYRAPVARVRSNQVRESWSFDRNGKVLMTRAVQFSGGTANIFDLDDFVESGVKFCLHGLNVLLRVRPMPEELEYVLSVSKLMGKTLQNSEMLEKPMRVGFVCRTLGNQSRGFNVVLKASPAQAVDALRNGLLRTLNGVVGAFDAMAPIGSGPMAIASHRFTSLFERLLSQLSLRAIAAVRQPPMP